MPPPRRTQADRRRATRSALMTAGRELFAAHGEAAVSAEQIVTHAGVTRGALYHHFQDKNDLFRAVFEELEEELCDELTAQLDAAPTAIEGLLRSVGGYLDVCQRPGIRQITLVDAPRVLGWEEWREIENRYALGMLTERLRMVASEGVGIEEPEVMAQLVFSAAVEAGLMISTAEDPAAMRARVEPVLMRIAAGLL